MKNEYKNLVTLRKGLLKAGYSYIRTASITDAVWRTKNHFDFKVLYNKASDIIAFFSAWENEPYGRKHWTQIYNNLRGVNQ